jgi:hypothetical protein
METAYLVCAIVGGTLIACQFLLTLLGLGGHHDAGGDHDVGSHDGGGHDASHDADHDQHQESSAASWFLSVLTFRTITAGLAFFGLTGLLLTRAETRENIALAGALAAGLLAVFIVRWLMQNLTRLNIDGTIRIDRAVGASGTVYLSVPANKAGHGKVHVLVNGRLIEYRAITPRNDLPTGSKIVVASVVDSDTVEVVPEQNTERVSP